MRRIILIGPRSAARPVILGSVVDNRILRIAVHLRVLVTGGLRKQTVSRESPSSGPQPFNVASDAYLTPQTDRRQHPDGDVPATRDTRQFRLQCQ